MVKLIQILLASRVGDLLSLLRTVLPTDRLGRRRGGCSKVGLNHRLEVGGSPSCSCPTYCTVIENPQSTQRAWVSAPIYGWHDISTVISILGATIFFKQKSIYQTRKLFKPLIIRLKQNNNIETYCWLSARRRLRRSLQTYNYNLYYREERKGTTTGNLNREFNSK